MSKNYDHIIIGGGAAGRAAAARLVTDGDRRVLLLEAGFSHRHPLLDMPPGIFKLINGSKYMTYHSTVPQEHLGGRLAIGRDIINVQDVFGKVFNEGAEFRRDGSQFDQLFDDGDRFAIVGWKQWSELLNIAEFANAQFVGEKELPWQGTQAKRWLGSLWFPHSGLTKTAGVRYCYWYHKTAVGHAIGSDVKTDISWHGDRAANFVNNMMSQGACLIDPAGVVSLRCLEA